MLHSHTTVSTLEPRELHSSSKNFKFTSIPHPKVSTAPIANKEIAVSYIQKGYQHYVKTGSVGVLSSWPHISSTTKGSCSG